MNLYTIISGFFSVLTIILTSFLGQSLNLYNRFNETIIHVPFAHSQEYYRGLFGIYSVNSSGCFDICFTKNFKRISEADKGTFEVIYDSLGQGTKFARDANHVYYDGRIMSDADPYTFEIISLSKPLVITKDNIIENYSQLTFSYDLNHKYMYGSKIGDDPEKKALFDLAISQLHTIIK